jgi:tight adherence protein B
MLVAVLVLPVGRWFVPAGIALAAVLVGRRLWGRRQKSRRAEAVAARVVEVCDLLAAELAAGRPPTVALEESATAWPELRPVADVVRLGGDVPAALRDVGSTVAGADGLRLLAGAWEVSHRTGAGLAGSTRRVAEAIRSEQETRRVVTGELASARATARLVAALPVAALLMGSGTGADPWRVLLGTPYGLACLAAGLAFGLAGLWWIEVIAREAAR